MSGPVILVRSGQLEGSLGELMWLVGGLLVWIFDIEGGLARPMADDALGDAAIRSGDGADDARRAGGGLEVRHGGQELVMDECHGLGLERILGWHGVQLMAARPGVAGQSGCAMILDGLDGDL